MPTVLTSAFPRLVPLAANYNKFSYIIGWKFSFPPLPTKQNCHSIKFQLFGAFFSLHAFSRFDWITSQMIAVIGISNGLET